MSDFFRQLIAFQLLATLFVLWICCVCFGSLEITVNSQVSGFKCDTRVLRIISSPMLLYPNQPMIVHCVFKLPSHIVYEVAGLCL